MGERRSIPLPEPTPIGIEADRRELSRLAASIDPAIGTFKIMRSETKYAVDPAIRARPPFWSVMEYDRAGDPRGLVFHSVDANEVAAFLRSRSRTVEG